MPGLSIIRGTSPSFDEGFPWSSYWANINRTEAYELWKITGSGNLVGLKRGDILTVGGTAGSYTFKVPNTLPYQSYDTDYIWFDTGVTWRTATEAEMIGYDFSRTIVKYQNVAPYSIEYIMILASASATDQENKMRDDFDLSIWWSNLLSVHGNLKGNRGIGRSSWKIIDADGNVYTSVVIGTQTWLVENLKTTKYNDGSAIPTGLINANWALEDGTVGHDGAFAQANNDSGNKAAYGLLYNQYAVNNSKGICPIGYYVPTKTERDTLMTFLGGTGVAGGKLKENGSFTYFLTPNTGAINSVGWCGRGAGYREPTGAVGSFKVIGAYWCSTSQDRFYLSKSNDDVVATVAWERSGFSVRCIKG